MPRDIVRGPGRSHHRTMPDRPYRSAQQVPLSAEAWGWAVEYWWAEVPVYLSVRQWEGERVSESSGRLQIRTRNPARLFFWSNSCEPYNGGKGACQRQTLIRAE